MRRHSFLAFVVIIYVSVVDARAQTGPSLIASTFSGGAGDQSGRAIWVSPSDNAIYLGGANGELVRYGIPQGTPAWNTKLNGASYLGLTSIGTTVYAVGTAMPPTCGASDGVGDTEPKSLLSRHVSSTGALIDCRSPNFFPYRGYENYKAVVDSIPFVYATGFGETCGFGNNSFVLSKFDLAGNLLQKVAEPDVDFNGFSCTGGSDSFGLALLNGNLYVAGYSRFEDGQYRPVLMKYSPDLVRQWKQRPTDNPGGLFLGVTAFGGALYAVGYVGVSGPPDFLIEKYDEAGNRIWSRTSGGAGDDTLYGVVGVGSRLYAVGSTNSQGSGGTDAVILEIDPNTGTTLSTTLFGGAQNDVAFGVATDGTDLYVVGESRSFASPEGNIVGQSDIMLLRYSLAPRTPPVISSLPAAGCTLWPANHRLVQVTAVTASDVLGLSSFNVTATSSEPENGLGDGDTAPDILITGNGLEPRVVQLRAERSGTGPGRTYTITATATNAVGLTTTAEATCVVPHDQGNR